MNILMALSQLEVTGAEVYATTVGNQLSRRGHQIFYVSDTLTKKHNGPFFKLRFNKRSVPRRFWHVFYLIYLIKKHNIQLVHAHSRASSWSCHLACKLTGTPMVTTVHGRQPVHSSSKKFHAMGDKVICVCESIQQQIVTELGVDMQKTVVSRNGIECNDFKVQAAPDNKKKIISIIGRLSGPKGDVCYQLLNQCIDLDKYQVRIISGTQVDKRFEPFKKQVEFSGYSNDVQTIIAQSDLVIGAGRVAMESLLCGRPTFAIGEASSIGDVTQDNIQQAMATNFGDIGKKGLNVDFSLLKPQIEKALQQTSCAPAVTEVIKQNYDLEKIVDQLEVIYQDTYVEKRSQEIPIIMYHRFIKDESEKGVHGTYLDIKMLEKHFKLLKRLNIETLTFADLKEAGTVSRLQPGKRYVIITVDDGYKDNYELLLPLLKKYNFKAVVYAVTGESFNRWDVEQTENPEKSVELMSAKQLKVLSESGYVEIGGHTLTHPKLDTLSYEQQFKEISENKKQLEAITGKPLISFAYPFGIHNQDSKDIAKELGYDFALATNSGPLAMHQDLYQIRRIAIFPRTDVFGLWRKIRGNYVFRKAK
ncbi:polysaccharide deacetylase family protein [Psychromonas aquimarina]|uniref:polysaccharide deacetylase family protein n=1 Tax=Psychromonas aquimarina TaxID=444919 RepID=UPI00040A893D|nr:polysaccharide deacetylase family protein [Psychromonas aquimarina]